MIFAAIACMVLPPATRENHPSRSGAKVLVFKLFLLVRQSFVFIAGFVLIPMPTAYAALCATLEDGPSGRVVAVSDGDTVDLDTGITVRLVGIQAPKLPLGRPGFEAWPLGEEARQALADMVMGQTVTLHYGGERRDRHGRALAHLSFQAPEGEIWVQEAMLEAGLARVYSFPDNRSCLGELYAAEARARAEGRGMWRHPEYALRRADRPDLLLDREGEYELVEGRVLTAARAGSMVYLNFGRFWREDFTVVIAPAAQRAFEEVGLDPLTLEDQLIRVRGWIEIHDGPRVEVTHPEQIEVLGAR